MIAAFHWPQWTAICLFIFTIVVTRDFTHFMGALVCAAIWTTILYFGGFWG